MAEHGSTPRLDVLKTLGDNTRYAIYLELARSAQPLTTADIAETLDLHPNTVRPHLERMRDVGLVDMHVQGRGEVGRPQHRFSVAADAPSLGLEPPVFPMLARMLASVAAAAGVLSDDAAEIGRQHGRATAEAVGADDSLAGLCASMDAMGFDPLVEAADDADEGESARAVVGFGHCPFRELAEAHPEIICHLHRGLVEGLIGDADDYAVSRFGTLSDREPCLVEVTVG